MQEAEIKDKILVGQTSKDDVLNELGSPSSQSSFGEETWYYITAHKETYAFLRPHIVDQNVVRIRFDGEGKVSAVDNYSLEDAREFDLVKRTTPTEGHTLGFIEQVIGNVGRFNSSETAAPGRRPSSQY